MPFITEVASNKGTRKKPLNYPSVAAIAEEISVGPQVWRPTCIQLKCEKEVNRHSKEFVIRAGAIGWWQGRHGLKEVFF